MTPDMKRPAAETAIKGAIARIVDAENKPHGCGALVDRRRVVTCAHVVAYASDGRVRMDQSATPTDKVLLTFPFLHSSAPPFHASVEIWRPVGAGHESRPEDRRLEDVAVLHLDADVPADLTPQPFMEATSWSGMSYLVHGYPADNPHGGDWADGTFRGEERIGYVQMLARDGADLQVEPGFSGAPVWDLDRGGVAGIVVITDLRKRNAKQLALMIPTGFLQEAWADLPVAAGATDALGSYVAEVREAARSPTWPWPPADPQFTLTVSGFGGDAVQAERLWEKVRSASGRRVVLLGAAGSGKSTVIGAVIRVCLERPSDCAPLLIDFKGWKAEYSARLHAADQETDPARRFPGMMRVLLRASVPEVSMERMEPLLRGRRRLLIADGLNEVDSYDVRKLLIEFFEEYTAGDPGRFVLVTEQAKPAALAKWVALRMDPLSEEERRRRLGTTVYDGLEEADKQLLESPYFLNLALKSNRASLGSRAAALELFFLHQIRLTERELNCLAKAAFDAYENSRATSFNRSRFKDQVGEELFKKLSDKGVLKEVDDARVKFDHQLKHDYLAAHYLARVSGDDRKWVWGRKTFDAVSFESDSPNSLVMALEQLGGPDEGDEFLRRVYDWNWEVVFPCLVASRRTAGERFSPEIRTALLALVANKRFEPVLGSRAHSRAVLNDFLDSAEKRFVEAESRADLVRMVGEVRFQAPPAWYSEWRDLFSLLPEAGRLGERHILRIASEDSIIGWTAANVVRRFLDMDESGRRQLRAMYVAAVSDDRRCEVIRWRAVHAMGVFADPENVARLREALDDDAYDWVRYGAARALTELAARFAGTTPSQEALSLLSERASRLPPRIQNEIGKVILYRDAPACWIDHALPLVNQFVVSQRGEAARRTWEERRTHFQGGAWRNE